MQLSSLFLRGVLAASLWLGIAHAAGGARDIGEINQTVTGTLGVSITGTPELVTLATRAFKAHGKYSVRPSSSVELNFTSAGGTAVTVTVRKSGAVVVTQTVNGSTARNALFKAADVAVKATSGLPGFFASKLAFVSNRTGHSEIYVSDLFLGDATAVTAQKSDVLTPRWSPDGSRLLYTSYFRSGFPDIFQIDLAARRWTTLVSFKGTNSGARYSPNGSSIVMVLSGEGNPEIYTSNPQGRGVSRKTKSGQEKSSPCYSPDGSRIVFAMAPGPQLYVMAAGGGTPSRIAGGFSSYCAEPDWSVGDPNKIAFTMREGRRFQIAVHDLRAGTTKMVSKAAYDAIEPSWCADGRHLVYTARASGTRSLYLLDTESGRATQLSTIYAEKGSVYGP